MKHLIHKTDYTRIKPEEVDIHHIRDLMVSHHPKLDVFLANGLASILVFDVLLNGSPPGTIEEIEEILAREYQVELSEGSFQAPGGRG